MKKILLIFLGLALILSMPACRRRTSADSETVAYETVYQPQPVPMEGQGQQVPDPAMAPQTDDTTAKNDPEGRYVDETIGAQGGETIPDAPKAKEAGAEITVTLDAAGGECSRDTVSVRTGGVYGLLPTPTKPGQTFQGWFLQPEGGAPVNPVTVVLEETDHTLYAHWTVKTEFILTFDPNGGRISPYSAVKTVYSGDVYGSLPEPLRSGYAFLGWFAQPEGGEAVQPTDMVTLIDDQTLYAHWEYDPYAYWGFILENTTQRVYTCQEVSVYLELEANGSTMAYCPLISDTGSGNIARYEESGMVTDDWVREKKPDIIIKLTDSMATAEVVQTAMERRFPNSRVYVFPTTAVDGSEAEQLYYKLWLAAICYPEWYHGIDMAVVSAELGVEGAPHS